MHFYRKLSMIAWYWKTEKEAKEPKWASPSNTHVPTHHHQHHLLPAPLATTRAAVVYILNILLPSWDKFLKISYSDSISQHLNFSSNQPSPLPDSKKKWQLSITFVKGEGGYHNIIGFPILKPKNYFSFGILQWYPLWCRENNWKYFYETRKPSWVEEPLKSLGPVRSVLEDSSKAKQLSSINGNSCWHRTWPLCLAWNDSMSSEDPTLPCSCGSEL